MPLQKDGDGDTIPFDDETVVADDCLLRRINPDHHLTLKEGRYRASSSAFSESSSSEGKFGGMSVQLERLAPNAVAQLPPDWGLVRIKVSALRARGCLVGIDPEPHDPSHTNVWGGPNGRPGKKVPVQETDYEWVVFPTRMRSHN